MALARVKMMRAALTCGDDHATLDKPPSDWDDPKALGALADSLAKGAQAALAVLGGHRRPVDLRATRRAGDCGFGEPLDGLAFLRWAPARTRATRCRELMAHQPAWAESRN